MTATAYSLFGQPASPGSLQADTGGYELGVEFFVTKPGTITGIWFYSAPGGVLPAQIQVFDVPGGATGASNAGPSWSGAAGSGWVKASFASAPVVLPGYRYKAAVFYGGGANWYSATSHYWDTGAGGSGLTSGPLAAPSNAGATGGGQDTFISAVSPSYPTTAINATNYWIDLELTVDEAQPVGVISGGPWTLAFNEGFDSPVGGKPDPAVWATHFIEGDAFRQENGSTEIGWSPHNAQNLSVANSVLTITASFAGAWPAMLTVDPACPNPTPAAANGGAQPSYVTGLIQSQPSFNCTYGYAEALMQVPDVANAWPAFWRHPSDGAWPPEIDIEESAFPPSQTATYHDAANVQTVFNYPGAPTDYTNWHVFGCRWTPSDITFFLDGAQVGTYTTAANIAVQPMHLIFDLAVQTAALPANFPCSMHIDYVRAWTVTGVPAAPMITRLAPGGTPGAAGTIICSFTPVAGATSYRVTGCPVDQYAAGLLNGPRNSVSGASSPLTLTGLKAGTAYTVSVAAINATGYSAESALAPPFPAAGGGSDRHHHRGHRP